MSAFWAVVKKELKSVLRERTILIAILIQLFVASFSSVLLIGMLSMYDTDTIVDVGGADINVGLVSAGNDLANMNSLSGLLSDQGTHVSVFPTFESARTVFDEGKLDAILVVPADQSVVTLRLYLPNQETGAAFTRMVLQKPLEAFENNLRVRQGVDVRYTGLKGKPSTSFEFIYTVILPILMFFPAFVAGGMVIDSLSEEVENNTLQTLLSTPISVTGLVLAKISAALLLSMLQCGAWLLLLQVNQITIQNLGWVLALAVVVSGIISTTAGLVVIFFKDRERSQFVFSLLLLAGAGGGYFLDISPLKTIARLAIADYYTGGWQVAVFALLWALLGLLLLRFSRRLLG